MGVLGPWGSARCTREEGDIWAWSPHHAPTRPQPRTGPEATAGPFLCPPPPQIHQNQTAPLGVGVLQETPPASAKVQLRRKCTHSPMTRQGPKGRGGAGMQMGTPQ